MMNTLRHWITALVACTLLSACVPAVFVAGAAIGGAVIYDQRALTTIKNDATISRDVVRYVNAQPDDVKKQMHVSVNVFNGVVLLAGQVPNEEIQNILQQEAESVPRVRVVYNKLTVGKPSSLSTRSKDAWITAKVKAELLTTKGLHSTQISLMTENHVVYLMGLVSRKQATLATEAVRRIHGVSKVVTLFEYLQ